MWILTAMEVWNTGKSQKCNINVDNGSLLMEYEIGGLRLKYKMKTPISWLKCTIILANIHFFFLFIFNMLLCLVVFFFYYYSSFFHLPLTKMWCTNAEKLHFSSYSGYGNETALNTMILCKEARERERWLKSRRDIVLWHTMKISPIAATDLKRLKSEEARKFIIKLIANSLAPA